MIANQILKKLKNRFGFLSKSSNKNIVNWYYLNYTSIYKYLTSNDPDVEIHRDDHHLRDFQQDEVLIRLP